MARVKLVSKPKVIKFPNRLKVITAGRTSQVVPLAVGNVITAQGELTYGGSGGTPTAALPELLACSRHGILPGAGDVTAAIQGLLDANPGKGVLFDRDGTYTVETELLPDKAVIVGRSRDGVILKRTTSADTKGVLEAKGSVGTSTALDADGLTGASSVTTTADPATVGIAKGDWVLLRTTREPWTGIQPDGELQKVRDITGAGPYTVSLFGELGRDYLTANAASIAEVTPKSVLIANLTIDCTASTQNRGLYFEYNVGTIVSNVRIKLPQFQGISMLGCTQCLIDGVIIDDVFSTASNGYGVLVTSWSTHNIVSRLVSTRTRHSVVLGEGASDNLIAHCVAINDQSRSFDVHGQDCRRNVFDACLAMGGVGQGFGTGNSSYGGDVGTKFVNCTARDLSISGFTVSQASTDTEIVNPTVERPGSHGIHIIGASLRTLVHGGRIVGAGTNGVYAETGANETSVRGTEIRTPGTYGIRLTASTDCIIDGPVRIVGSGNFGIWLDNADEAQVEAVVDAPGAHGIRIVNSDDVNVGGRFTNAGGTAQHGISVANSLRCAVRAGTVCTGNSGKGIESTGTADSLIVVGVNANGNTDGSNDITYVGSNNIVSRNLGRYTPQGTADKLTATATLDFASIAAQTCATLTITVTGAATGDTVLLGPPSGLEAGLSATGYVSAANTVTVRLCNVTSAAIDPASSTWRATVQKA